MPKFLFISFTFHPFFTERERGERETTTLDACNQRYEQFITLITPAMLSCITCTHNTRFYPLPSELYWNINVFGYGGALEILNCIRNFEFRL